MSQHVGVGNVGIYGSAVGGAATATATLADKVTEHAVMIGLGLTLVSLLVGVIFKVIAVRQTERHHREELEAQREDNARLAKALRAEIKGLKD